MVTRLARLGPQCIEVGSPLRSQQQDPHVRRGFAGDLLGDQHRRQPGDHLAPIRRLTHVP